MNHMHYEPYALDRPHTPCAPNASCVPDEPHAPCAHEPCKPLELKEPD